MNKRIILFIVGLLWIAVAVGLILSKQYTLCTGKTIALETVPVDPRDFLRGDYVVLNYKISRLDLNQIKSEKTHYVSGKNIFVELESKGKFWEAVAVYERKALATGKILIKGKVKSCHNKNLHIDYGVENYFLPEGEGMDIEKNMRGSKSSVNVEVIVDSKGNALIKKIYIDK